jgi:hypothetical protein
MDTTRVCETCGSENVRTSGDGGMGFCEDCDAPCSTVEAPEVDLFDFVRAHKEDEEEDDPRSEFSVQ